MSNKLIKIGDLPTGSIVIDKESLWEHRTGDGYTGSGEKKPLEWLIVAQNHYKDGETTVITKDIIGKFAFDDSTDRSSDYGSNHWGESGTTNAKVGIRPWLNSTFYDSFGDKFKEAVIETLLDNVDYKGVPYVTKDKIWLPSQTEMGLGEKDTFKIGMDFGYFRDNASRIARLGSENHYYRTRSPYAINSNIIRNVYSDGSNSNNYYAYNAYPGVRPVLHLKSNNLVKHIKDNIYEFIGILRWDLPVVFKKRGIVSIQADSLEEATQMFNENSFLIPLPEDSDYVEGSFKLE